MPQKPTSLDELISRRAEEFADQVRAAAEMAANEEEIRIEAERQLAFIAREAGVTLEGRHEFTLASGRVDSVYDRVIIEYKNPSSPGAKIGPNANSPGAKKVVEQIKRRFYDMRTQYGDPWNTLFGVGLDGRHFIFVRFYNDKWQVQDPVEVNKHSTERFLWALFNLGTKGKRFDPEYLAGDFGSAEGSIAASGIKVLYYAISATDNPKALTFFQQWKILFGEVCGYDVDNPSDKIKKLADFYDVSVRDVKPAELLFSVHTYYALFMKLLAGEILGHFHKLPSLLGKMIAAPSAAALKRELGELEAGGIFRHLGITNFLEGDLFAWYLPAWSDDIEGLVRKMTARLDQYNPGTLAEEPAESRDMLKKLYQQLFPKSVRHDLGEYYTPDWLAEHVLNELGYVGDPDKRLLDPACGSGTFLVMAITRIRAWYEKNRETLHYDEGELCKKILANVVGFDLNPLAVMAARTNYLIAIRDLVSHVDKVEIPVYLCDSILTPSTYGGLFAGSTTVAKELKTSAAKFIVPTEIATNADDVAKYAEQLEFCVRNAYAPREFIRRCHDEGLPITLESLHLDLYKELVRLDKANKNGVWARIIKNSFAPLFVGQVSFVAGNPPWVTFENLPANYRPELIKLFDEHYGLFQASGLDARHGASAIDLSALFPYVCCEEYLVPGGRLGFVITQTLFQSTAGAGFRKFALPDGTRLGISHMDDMVSLQPFDGATNRTGVFILTRDRPTQFPIPCRVWRWAAGRPDAVLEMPLEDVLSSTARSEAEANPVTPGEPTSPWLIARADAEKALRKVRGECAYQPHKGCDTSGANAIFWVEILQSGKDKTVIRNLGNAGRKHKFDFVEHSVEKKYIFPLLRGRDVSRWIPLPSCYILCAQTPDDFGHGISEATLKIEAPQLYSYFNRPVFRKRLEERAGYRKYLQPHGEPFYALYDIKNYTTSDWKVVIREQASMLTAAVVGPVDGRTVIPDHKLSLIAVKSEDEALFICGLLNSSPARLLIRVFGISTQISVSTIRRLRLPNYRSQDAAHAAVVSCARACRSAAMAQLPSPRSLEEQLDDAVAAVWRLSAKEMDAVREELVHLSATTETSEVPDD